MSNGDPETIEDAIKQRAIDGVRKSIEGERTVEYQTIDEQIKADQYLGGKEAAKKAHRGIYITRLIPPGTG